MRLTTKGRFAVTAMLDIALRRDTGPVTLAMISQRQQISLSYLEQLFGKLRRKDLVESTRGPGGGYTLGREPGDISVADIVLSVDEPIDATHCGGKGNCRTDGGRCLTHDLWSSLNDHLMNFLHSVTLEGLVNERIAQGADADDAQDADVSGAPAIKRAISRMPVVKPIRVRSPNSVFALGGYASK
ncbi:MAG: Fe-S cluster assembly transcription factor [Burkholderiaceae bacterium]|jgi:Rrf2 family iron-sulfur cluster assembly transcriptional regulator|nr:Fe-S cluster assembly transcription factor [Burkholderiaceae bacterium]